MQRNSEARGLIPDQDWETGFMPLTCRPSAQPPLSHEALTGFSSSSWPTFTPLSLSASISMYEFLYFPTNICAFLMVFSLSANVTSSSLLFLFVTFDLNDSLAAKTSNYMKNVIHAYKKIST